MTYRDVARRLDRVEEKQDKIYDLLFNGSGKIATNREAISNLKKWVGGLGVAILAMIGWIVTILRGIK